VLSALAAAGLGRVLIHRGRPRLVAELAVLAVVAWIAADAGAVARGPMSHAFWMQLPPGLTRRTGDFHQEKTVPPHLKYVRPDWAPPSLPGMIAGTGILECWSVVPMSVFAKDATGKVPGQGAIGRGDPAYRGEVSTESGRGNPRIATFTPNEVVVQVEDGVAGDRLRLNQNYHPGWTANGNQAENAQDTPALRLRGGRQTVVFRYTPVHLGLGLVLLATTAAAAAVLWLRERRRAAFHPVPRRG
jgi:hypothetical protein